MTMAAYAGARLTLVGSGVTGSCDDVEQRCCAECGYRIPKGSRTDKEYCTDRCRQAAYRKRKKEAA
jgi:hypothetical protein